MISYSSVEQLKEIISDIFQYGFDKKYHLKVIEERLIRSNLIINLEKNDDSLLDKMTFDQIICDIYSLSTEETINTCYSDLSYWLSSIYIDLFFQYKKSFSYLFLYLPLEDAIKKYDLYHEMDITQLLNLFDQNQKQQTILSKVLKEKEISTKQLSVLSGISIHTLNGYCKSNEILYGARFDYIMLISQILNVNPNIFIRNIYISNPVMSNLSSIIDAKIEKDIYMYFNTQELNQNYIFNKDNKVLIGKSNEVKFFDDDNITYDELIKKINKYVEKCNRSAVVSADKKIIDQIKPNKKIIILSKDKLIDYKKRVKVIPSIVKEYALIRANEPYFDID